MDPVLPDAYGDLPLPSRWIPVLMPELKFLGSDRDFLPGLKPTFKRESPSAVDYGSAERQEAFAASLADTGANDSQVRGRVAAERSEGTHPGAAVTMGREAVKARKTRAGATAGAERTKSGLAR